MYSSGLHIPKQEVTKRLHLIPSLTRETARKFVPMSDQEEKNAITQVVVSNLATHSNFTSQVLSQINTASQRFSVNAWQIRKKVRNSQCRCLKTNFELVNPSFRQADILVAP